MRGLTIGSTVLTLYWFRTETQAIYSTTRNNFKRLLPFQRLLISFRMKYLRIINIITAPQIIPPLMQYGPSDIFTRSFFFFTLERGGYFMLFLLRSWYYTHSYFRAHILILLLRGDLTHRVVSGCLFRWL